MLKNKTKSIKCEEVVLYSSYLGLDEDSQYIRYLINNLTNLFIEKVNKIGMAKLKDGNFNLDSLRYSKEELKVLGPFARDCLDFKNSFVINLNNKVFYLDKYGVIVGDDASYLGKNILEIPELWEYTILFRKQIFISKIYQAIKENLNVVKRDYAKIFEFVNEEYLSYEENFNNLTKGFSFPKDSLVRTRSLR